MKQKLSFDWKKILLFIFLSAGLLYITNSVPMTAGILILLFVIDYMLAQWEERKRLKKMMKEWEDERRKEAQNQSSKVENDETNH